MPRKEYTDNNISKPKRKKRSHFGLLYLFLFAFLAALACISYLVKSYSPDIDVTIGNNEALTLNESEMDVEIKSVDERLKWIQMEDELPTVAVRESDVSKNEISDKKIDELKDEKLSDINSDKNIEKNSDKNLEKKSEKKEPPVPTISDIKKHAEEFKNIPEATPVSDAPKPSVTKVYLGKFTSLEEAMFVQSSVAAAEPSVVPFIKSYSDHYIVQLGSFSDKEKADKLVNKLKTKGFNPKIQSSN